MRDESSSPAVVHFYTPEQVASGEIWKDVPRRPVQIVKPSDPPPAAVVGSDTLSYARDDVLRRAVTPGPVGSLSGSFVPHRRRKRR